MTEPPRNWPKPPALIAVDWGSSSFRAYLMARDGAILDEFASFDGVVTIAPGGFPTALSRLVDGWLRAHPDLPGRRLGHGRQPPRLA